MKNPKMEDRVQNQPAPANEITGDDPNRSRNHKHARDAKYIRPCELVRIEAPWILIFFGMLVSSMEPYWEGRRRLGSDERGWDARDYRIRELSQTRKSSSLS
jgi:hypothetical protein